MADQTTRIRANEQLNGLLLRAAYNRTSDTSDPHAGQTGLHVVVMDGVTPSTVVHARRLRKKDGATSSIFPFRFMKTAGRMAAVISKTTRGATDPDRNTNVRPACLARVLARLEAGRPIQHY